jgi:hypothetical protein
VAPAAGEGPHDDGEADLELRLATIERDLAELRSVVAQLRTLVD